MTQISQMGWRRKAERLSADSADGRRGGIGRIRGWRRWGRRGDADERKRRGVGGGLMLVPRHAGAHWPVRGAG